MSKPVREQLMTVEEAIRLSHGEYEERDRRVGETRRNIWSWQSVEGVMAQEISEESLNQMAALADKDR